MQVNWQLTDNLPFFDHLKGTLLVTGYANGNALVTNLKGTLLVTGYANGNALVTNILLGISQLM